METKTKAWGAALSVAGLILVVAALSLSLQMAGGAGAVYAQENRCWQLESVAGTSAQITELRGIAALGAEDAWAVGYEQVGAQQMLIVRWDSDGTAWSRFPNPGLATGARDSRLNGVAALAPDDVWAVGSYHRQGGSEPLIVHYDGARWSQSLAPDFGAGTEAELFAVAGASPNDVWAVGSLNAAPLILHWDGTAWSRVPIPYGGAGMGRLYSVTAISANDVWAVGEGTAFLHWNGTAWSVQPVEINATYRGISAISSTDIWAVGSRPRPPYNNTTEGVTLRWNGVAWRHVPSFNPGLFTYLYGVSAVAPDEVWAVGGERGPAKGYPGLVGHTFILRWNGTDWARAPSQVSPSTFPSTLYAVDARAAVSAWAVGSDYEYPSSRGSMIILRRLAGSCAPQTPIPQITPPPVLPPAPLAPPVPLPGTGSITFPETGKTLSGIFLKYWQEHGGLAQQGYPISNVMGEVSDLNGKLYTVQYFERAVFEYHPENKPPYDVLLSQLGTFQYRNRYPHGAPNQRPNNDPGSLFFPQTGKKLGGAFHYYWLNNGGLMQQGYPVSDELTERSPLDGKEYTVQYFERAVLEWHPENRGTPYEVLLSHLGRFRYDSKYAPQPLPAPPPTPKLLSATVEGPVVSSGRTFYWIDTRSPNLPIYGYNLDEGREFLVTDTPGVKSSLTTDGKLLAWIERSAPPGGAVRAHNLATRQESIIFTPTDTPPAMTEIALDSGILYYVGINQGRQGLHALTLATQQDRLIANLAYRLVAKDGLLLWSEDVSLCAFKPCISRFRLHALKSDGSMGDTVLAESEGSNFGGYDVSGDNIVWSPSGQPGPRLYNINTRIPRAIGASFALDPFFAGRKVVWTTPPEASIGGQGYSAVQLYDMDTGVTGEMLSSAAVRLNTRATVGGTMLVYTTRDDLGVLRLWLTPLN